ncbi:MAG: hypothetical protein ACLVJ6_00885 [Merdibacter sp.]
MNGFTPGLDRRPPPLNEWTRQPILKVLGRSLSDFGAFLSKLKWAEAILGLSRLDYPLAKTGGTVNGGAFYMRRSS